MIYSEAFICCARHKMYLCYFDATWTVHSPLTGRLIESGRPGFRQGCLTRKAKYVINCDFIVCRDSQLDLILTNVLDNVGMH